jgi:hypothetical protein
MHDSKMRVEARLALVEEGTCNCREGKQVALGWDRYQPCGELRRSLAVERPASCKVAADNDVDGHTRWTAVVCSTDNLERAGGRAVSLDSSRSKSRVLNSVYIMCMIALPFLPVRPIICPNIDACGQTQFPRLQSPTPSQLFLSAIRLLTIAVGDVNKLFWRPLTVAVIR